MNKICFHLLSLALLALPSLSIQADGQSNNKIKNVILIIGDGMGPAQIGLLETYARQATNPVIENRITAFTRMLNEGAALGISMTYAANVMGTDSASSATQLATGKAARPDTIGIDSDGNSSVTALEIAKKLGKSTGLVSDVRLTHATPASFAAHQASRTMENKIAIDLLTTGVDVMLSGGLRHWIPEQANDKSSAIFKQLTELTTGSIKITSKRKDQRNLLMEAQQAGYQLAFNKQQLDAISEQSGKILGIFSDSNLPNGIKAHRTKNHSTIPTLKEMSAKALDVLQKNDQGFFLMIEAGLIDWAAHDNDTGTLLHEMLKINETLNYVLDWAAKREDTMVIVTADHETGGFGFSYSANNILASISLPGAAFKETGYQSSFNYGATQILDKLYNQKLSYDDMLSKVFDSLDSEQKTPLALMKIINQNTEFKITEQQAARVLATEQNDYYVADHKDLSLKQVPKMDVNDAFFVYQSDNRRNLLAIEVAEQQSVVWSNGTHTASPVLVFVKGNKKVSDDFVRFMWQPELGQKIIELIKAD
ncbi:MAG: alkaline phosphatase [Gammaproteobacteria bacterium]|nr:MAG: alkaline phosphatase [Gammaproteobacteria bacterium]